MDFDAQFCDDSTSCSSSISTPFVEDIDDLRLGAEANMFSRNGDDAKSKKAPLQDFIIIKERCESGNANLDVTFSTISSISELIDAREGNPEDLLFSLGFDSFEGEDSHYSILSRFGSSHDQDEHRQFHTGPNGSVSASDIVPDTHDSIVKTQDWLDNHQHVSCSQTQPKEDAGGSKTVGLSQGQGKRLAAQKKRSRWSKSRQSSFDLLPNLEEEGTSLNGNSCCAFAHRKQKQVASIRESSQEEDFLNIANQETTISRTWNIDVINSLCQITERSQSLHQATCFEGGSHQVPTSDPSSTVFLTNSSTLMSKVYSSDFSKAEEHSPYFSPLKHLNLAGMKVDSFELEEIVSNDGHTSPNLFRYAKQSAITLAQSNTTMINPFQNSCATDQESTKSSSSLSSSDFSSGFDEGLEDVDQAAAREDCANVHDEIRRMSEPELLEVAIAPKDTWADDLSRGICLCAVNECAKTPLERLKNFCAVKSKMACASGIAEYSLFTRGKLCSFKDCSTDTAFNNERSSPSWRKSKGTESGHDEVHPFNQWRSAKASRILTDKEMNICLNQREPDFIESSKSHLSGGTYNSNNSNSCGVSYGQKLVHNLSLPCLHLPCTARNGETSTGSFGNHASLLSSMSDASYISHRVVSKSTSHLVHCSEMSQIPNNKELNSVTTLGCSFCDVHFISLNRIQSNHVHMEHDCSYGPQHCEAASAPCHEYPCQKHAKKELCFMSMRTQSSYEHLS